MTDSVIHNKSFDTVLILGYVLNSDGSPKPELLARLEAGLLVFFDNPFSRILVSGRGRDGRFSEAEVMREWLISRGVDDHSILVEGDSVNTVENVVQSTQILVALNSKRVCLITGPLHMMRAAALFSFNLSKIDKIIEIVLNASCPVKTSRDEAEDIKSEMKFLSEDLVRISQLRYFRVSNEPL